MARYGFVRHWPIWKDVLMGAFLITFTVWLALWGIPALGQTHADCQARLKAPAFDKLRVKVAEPAQPTLEQLADQTYPSDEEQLAIVELDRVRIECANLWVKENGDLPEAALSAFSRAILDEQAARADLFLGKATFGEYNRKASSIYRTLSAEFDRIAQLEDARQRSQGRDTARRAAAGVQRALPTYNPFPKPLICTSTRRGTLVDTFCR